MKVDLQFIAEKAEVSKSLVSKVLNGREVRVSEEKRKLIIELADKFNYHSNLMAASLRKQKSNVIALVLPTLYFEFFSTLANTIEREAQKMGYQVLICNTEEDLDIERHYLEMYRNGMLGGMILSPSDDDKNLDIIKSMNSQEFPLVFVDRYIEGLENSFVTTDSYKGASFLAEQLVKKGHKKIYFLSHTKSPNTSVQRDRYNGYFDVVKKNGFEERRIWIPDEFEEAKAILNGILTSDDRPSAFLIVTSWDIRPLLHACYQLGLKIPDDIEIAAFDKFVIPYTTEMDIKVARNVLKPIMLVDQCPQCIGEKAIRLLIDIVEGRSRKSEKIFLKPKVLNDE